MNSEIFFSFVIGLITYVLLSLVLYTTAKTNSFHNTAYIAWLPIINIYLLFQLIAKGMDSKRQHSNAIKLLVIYFITMTIFILLSNFGIMFSIALLVICYFPYYKLFYRWTAQNNKSTLYLVATILTGGFFFIVYGLTCISPSKRKENTYCPITS